MTIANALNRVNEIKRLANNMRLLNQHFLNEDKDKLEEIADCHGINQNLQDLTEKAAFELESLAEVMHQNIMNMPLENTSYPFTFVKSAE